MYCVYILANRKYGALYIGVTNDLSRRLSEHSATGRNSFTSKYGIVNLVYFEIHDRISEAIAREKQLKNWQRAWKIQLIETSNPDWKDVSNDIPYV